MWIARKYRRKTLKRFAKAYGLKSFIELLNHERKEAYK